MSIDDLFTEARYKKIGESMHRMIADLYPICRSITGDGVRETLRMVGERIPLETFEVPTGTQVFDWTVPKEWNIRDAWVKTRRGERVIDFQDSNLHVLNYSVPIRKTVSVDELKARLSTIPERPDWVPYRTSYYKEDWGFCASHNTVEDLTEDEYEVCIDSTLKDGHLTYGELYLRGETTNEILLSTHVCHPSMCNDNLSGVSLATMLAEAMGTVTHRYSYRFLFVPGTIGAITWLARNEAQASRIQHGLVLTGVGDRGPITYKRSRTGCAEIDRAVALVLKASDEAHRVIDFHPYGYDERQFCSPGFNLPVGRFTRTPYGEYPEYHTSADNLDFVTSEALGDSFQKVLRIFQVLEHNRVYTNTNPKCEPQLGKRGLYGEFPEDQLAMLWVLNQSDGEHSLLDIAERSGLEFERIARMADRLLGSELLTAQ